MNTAIVMLGSNLDCERNLALAKEKINERYEVVQESKIVETTPHGSRYKDNFLNQAVEVLSDEDLANSISFFKNLEKEMGRTTESKNDGTVCIDIDIIFWNDKQIRGDYDRYGFVKTCVDEILANKKLNL